MTTYICSARAATVVKALRLPREILGELSVTAPSLRIQALLGLSEELSGEKFHGAAAVFKPADPALHIREIAGWLSLIVIPPSIYFLADANGLIVEASLFLAILSTTVLMWLFSLTEEFVPPLLAIAAVLIVGLVPAKVALAGFSSPTMVRETLLHAKNGKAARIAVLTSPTSTGLARLGQVEQFTWAPHTYTEAANLEGLHFP